VLVMSPKAYNEKVGLVLICPITSKQKGYPFEVRVSHRDIAGVVLSDQIKNLDWNVRRIEFVGKIHSSTLHEVRDRSKVLLDF
jgi:mRNA interferase MazF